MARFLAEPDRPLLVVPSPPQAFTCAECLMARSGLAADYIKPYVLPFRKLADVIHEAAPKTGFRAIGSTFQRLILAELIPKTLRGDDYLGRMRDTPGFVSLLVERIREWKLAGITPDTLESGAHAAFCPEETPASLRKTTEFARLFRAYEAFLARYRFCDAEDNLQLATERVLEGAVPRNASLILIDGFFWFNRTQRQLLAALASNHARCEVAVTLPADTMRPLLFAAPNRTLAALRSEFTPCETTLTACAESRLRPSHCWKGGFLPRIRWRKPPPFRYR